MGIGFKTADTIATSVGIAPTAPERIKAGLAYTLSEVADDGHCTCPPVPCQNSYMVPELVFPLLVSLLSGTRARP
jgi:hypothetical protein